MMTLPKYTLTGTIHESASTIHYRGYRNADRTPVVIKLLKGQYPKPRDLIRLRHEYAIMSYLKAPGIIKPYALESYENSLLLVMEDVSGRPLCDVMRAKKLSIEAFLHIAISIANTLEWVHQRDVIHKDIKPHNLLIDIETWQVTLIDFGIATRLPREIQRAGNPATLEGTLAYMAPEQTGRMNRVIDLRADLYALGVTFYEVLVGALPFKDTDPLVLLHSHIARSAAPPHELVSEIPRVLSDIVMKLLAKAAEDRYQRARGLRADLEECLRRWRATGYIEPFPLARYDRTGELRLSQKLYGRESELAALLAAFDRVGEGATELLRVSGYSGVGKSALVHEIHKGIARRQGYFISGKFDQLSRSVPYAPMVHAFGELIQLILTDRAEVVAAWREKLLAALGPNGRVIADVIPDVELLIGPQPPVQELGPLESQNRWNLVFRSFLRVFTTSEHPLVLFLDDLQWVDAASLRLLQLLLTDPESGALLLIGAYRDNEVDVAHPLEAALSELRKVGVRVNAITLQPLDFTHVNQVIADALIQDARLVAPLAEIVWRKTDGNPFFMNQFLLTLHRQGLLTYEAASTSWQWDLQGIQGMTSMENVVALMASKIRRLAPTTQRVLWLGACIGHQFDLATLSTIHEKSTAGTAADLWEALSEGLLLPLDSEYRYYHSAADEDAEALGPELDLNVTYKFLHDRVQQAAYSLIEDGQDKQVHLRIGRLLRERSGRTPADDQRFEILRHLNFAAALIQDPGERLELAWWNLSAGKNAKTALANEAAAAYLATGISLLGEGGWNAEYDLTFALHSELAECEYLNNRFDEAERLFDIALSRARSVLDRARIHNLRIILYATLGKFADAISAARAGLALFGMDLPEGGDALRAAVAAELAEAEQNVAGRRVEELFNTPPMTDPETIAALKLLMDATAAAYLVDPVSLYVLVVVKQVNLSLKHGQSETSDYGYMSYAYVLAGILGRYKEGYEFGKLALDLNEKLNRVQQACKLNFLITVFLHFIKPIQMSLSYNEIAHRVGLETGDFSYLSWNCHQTVLARFGRGEDLVTVLGEVDKSLALMQRTRNAMVTVFLTVAKQVIQCLRGETRDRLSLSDGQFNEDELVASVEGGNFAFVVCWYCALKSELLYLHGDYAGALAAATLGEANADRSRGYYFITELPLYASLAMAALYPAAGPEAQRAYADAIGKNLARIRVWAESCPENYRHKQLLLEAELARITGHDGADIAALYDGAIEEARQHEFTQHEAIASELCARFYLSQGRKRIALAYMSDAYYAYKKWGAIVKMADLAGEYPAAAFNVETGPASTIASATASITGTIGDQAVMGKFDVRSIIRAAAAIVGEIVLEKVLTRWMSTVIEIAGAQRGFLAISRGGALLVEASITVDPDAVNVGLSLPLEACSRDLALTVVQYVANTHESVVLDDAVNDHRFVHDPYIAEKRPKSLLCTPMMYHGLLEGVLYLENGSLPHAFSATRVELIGLLSSQAAIAIGNALMVERVQHISEELRRANERLQRELEERARGETERAMLQEEVIQIQNTMLAELSTPMIPISEGIMVMPLVGSMDTRRAEQVLETALSGVQESGTTVVILDITGMKLIDSSIAATLMKTAHALRLLGTEAVLTGVRPEVAQALVRLDVDLGAIVIRGTLQSGVAYALDRSGHGAGRFGKAPQGRGLTAPRRP